MLIDVNFIHRNEHATELQMIALTIIAAAIAVMALALVFTAIQHANA